MAWKEKKSTSAPATSAVVTVAMIGVAIASSMAGVWTIAAQNLYDMDLETAYRYMFLAAGAANVVAIFVALTIRSGEEGRES